MKKLITVWKRWNKEKEIYQHNHFNYDIIYQNKPVPISPIQKSSWKGGDWIKEFAFLADKPNSRYGVPVIEKVSEELVMVLY
jgi:hypothetical protein